MYSPQVFCILLLMTIHSHCAYLWTLGSGGQVVAQFIDTDPNLPNNDKAEQGQAFNLKALSHVGCPTEVRKEGMFWQGPTLCAPDMEGCTIDKNYSCSVPCACEVGWGTLNCPVHQPELLGPIQVWGPTAHQWGPYPKRSLIFAPRCPHDPYWNIPRPFGLASQTSGCLIEITRSNLRQPRPIGPLAPWMVELAPTASILNPKPDEVPMEPSVRSMENPISSSQIADLTSHEVQKPNSPEISATFLNMLSSVHLILNYTNPQLASDCWICFDSQLPYFIGLALADQIIGTQTQLTCEWDPFKITLGDIQGTGTCLITSSTDPSDPLLQSCNPSTLIVIPTTPTADDMVWYQASKNSWFACRDGLVQCIYTGTFRSNPNPFCILVAVFPQLSLLPGEDGRGWFSTHFSSPEIYGQCQAIQLLPLFVGLGLAGTTVLNTKALIKSSMRYAELNAQINQDFMYIKSSISKLEGQVDSLADMVLQNHKGLDLLLIRQGGLCAVLNEECCFYANNSGVIRESLALVRKDLESRKEQTVEQNWYQSLFISSLWLTTFIMCLLGLFLLFILIVTIGPYMLSNLVSFVQRQVESIRIMVMQTLSYIEDSRI